MYVSCVSLCYVYLTESVTHVNLYVSCVNCARCASSVVIHILAVMCNGQCAKRDLCNK